jgi:hypothetical protein
VHGLDEFNRELDEQGNSIFSVTPRLAGGVLAPVYGVALVSECRLAYSVRMDRKFS